MYTNMSLTDRLNLIVNLHEQSLIQDYGFGFVLIKGSRREACCEDERGLLAYSNSSKPRS